MTNRRAPHFVGVPGLAVLALVCCLAAASSCRAEVTSADRSATLTSAPSPIVFAEGSRWSIGKFFAGLTTRARIVQFCVIVMIFALVILCKKLVAAEPAYRPLPRLTETARGAAIDRNNEHP